MAQQLNLYGPGFRRQRDGLDARVALRVLLLALLFFVLLGGVLAWRMRPSAPAEQAGDQAWRAQQAQVQELKAALAARRQRVEAELARVRQVEQAIARVQAALQGGTDGTGDGGMPYSAYFQALANQAHGALWITGFSVSADGRALELKGRALDAAALPDYLSHLNAEPVFRGRQFTQLNLASVLPEGAPEGASPLTEFTLRSGGPLDAKEAR